MSKTQLTVTEALVKLKLYEKRISDEMGRLQLITVVPANGVPTGYKSDDEFRKKSEAQIQSLDQLMKNRDSLKKAIVESNARTNVKVGEVTMTVAEAIERKTSIQFSKTLLAGLDKAFAWADNTKNENDKTLEMQADTFIKNLNFPANTEAKTISDTRENFVRSRQARQVYAESVKNKRDQLRKSVEDFEANVDVALSVTNAVTLLEVEL